LHEQRSSKTKTKGGDSISNAIVKGNRFNLTPLPLVVMTTPDYSMSVITVYKE